MIAPRDALYSIVRPALLSMPPEYDSPEARVLLIAIGLQESGFRDKVQMVGPARGYWQFEMNGIRAVLEHPKSQAMATKCCLDAHRAPTVNSVYRTLTDNDVLACQFARLLIYTDPLPLPECNDTLGAWDYYTRNWRPGRPRPDSWLQNHTAATNAVLPPRVEPEGEQA